MKDVIIVGGGLAGLTAAIQLANAGLKVLLLEKHHFPLHKVCGEYISNEVRPYLEGLGAYPEQYRPSEINRFRLSSISGKAVSMALSMGGFGISRYRLDEFLCVRAQEVGATVQQGAHVQEIFREDKGFRVSLKGGAVEHSRLLIGAWGKRSRLDKQLARPFMDYRSNYIGVKYHIRATLPPDEIALHNFPGGYCGVSKIEDNTWNLCYLGDRRRLRRWGSLAAMEEKDLQQNPHLKKIFREANFLFEKPLVINEISFKQKQAVQNGIFMVGDAAGLITPLCGNGMAMAIHGGKILSELILQHYQPTEHWQQAGLEHAYKNAWHTAFARRLWMGRQLQQLFGRAVVADLALGLLSLKPLGRLLVRQTHGQYI